MKTFIISLFPLFIGLLIADIFIVQLPITLKLIIKDVLASIISAVILLFIDKKFKTNK